VRSARNLYRLNAALALLGTAVVIAGGTVALGRIDLEPGPIGRLVSDCGRFLVPSLTAAGLAVLGLALLGVLVLARGLLSASRRILACRRFLRALDVVGERELPSARVILFAGSRAQAFCAGFVRPRVYLSRPTAELLSGEQLAAVLAHEAHHVRRRDPLRLLLLTAVGDGMFFLPALGRLRDRYSELAELAADEAALAAVGDPSHLAAALLQFQEGVLSGAVGIDPERVDHLLGSAPRWEPPVAAIAGALLTLGVLFAVVLTTAASAAAARTSVAQLAAQSCMIAMTAGPILALVGLALFRRRTIARGR
jgi:Zn-dependent protease with chaperone function